MGGDPCLLLIRPEAQSLAFLADCETRLGRKIDAVVSPIIDIKPIGDVPDLGRFGTVVLTSGNAVQRLSADLAGRSVATVGENTAALARSFGADATALGDTASALLDRADVLVPPVLICRGVHTRVDLETVLNARNILTEGAIVYDQVAQALTSDAEALLQGDRPVIVPLFSPRSAKLLSKTPHSAPLIVVAISDAVKDSWAGDPVALVAKTPTSEAVCDLVAEAL